MATEQAGLRRLVVV